MTTSGETSVIVEAATSDVHTTRELGPRFGPYRLLRLLGRGGMAAVWAAELRGSAERERVALKLILPHLRDDPEVVRMFRDEARLALLLRHPHVARALSSGWIDGQPFIAFELIEGLDLRACLDAHVPFAFAARVTRALCAALSYAHALSDGDGRWLELVHRDVTPSNVMLGLDGTIKLLDFGIAKALGDRSADGTRHGVVKGKIGYMAPELIAGRAFDRRADIFSLGVILYELLTHRPFSASSPPEQRRGPEARVVPPSQIVAGVPPALERAVLRALALDPHERYATADELGADLDEVLRASPWSEAQTIALVKALALRGDGGEPARTRNAAPPRTRTMIAEAPTRRAASARAKWSAAALFAVVFAATVAATQAAGDARPTSEEERAPTAAEWNVAADAEALLAHDPQPPVLRAQDLQDPQDSQDPVDAATQRRNAPPPRWHRPPRPTTRVAQPRGHGSGVELARSSLFNPFAPAGARR